MTRYDKILGGLLGAAVGDAMGAATETRPADAIKEFFGGWVRDIIPSPEDVFARGCPAGFVTDDFSIAYYTAKEIAKRKGVIDKDTAEGALLNWFESPYTYMAGPTTCGAIMALKGEPPTPTYPFLSYDNTKGSNGSAMKIGPVGLVNAGNPDKAIKDAITICAPTHGNNVALSGGCAVAASVAVAMQDGATIYDLVEAGLKGAAAGDKAGREHFKTICGPSIVKRINLAVEIALRCGDVEKTMFELADIIGSGLAAAEAVPCAYGLMVAAKGDALESIIGGVNIGNDTDTIATIVGSMTGALNGYFDRKYIDLINKANNFDLEGVAKELDACY